MSTIITGPVPASTSTQTMRDETLDEQARTAVEQAAADIVGDAQAKAVTQELFDGAEYQIDGAKFDGKAADTVKIAFGGGVELEADDPLFADMTLGSYVTLLVHGRVVKKTGTFKGTDDGDGEITVTGQATVKVDSITVE